MSKPTTPPTTLTPAFCFHPSALRSFLRQSRSLIDDPINTSLNSLLTPSNEPTSPRDPFTSALGMTQRTGPTPHTLPAPLCSTYTSQVLFPTWHSRSQVLEYCASIATSPDPDDPDAVEREVYNRRGAERVVDERLDPYSGRFQARESRTEELARTIRSEQGVERVLRERGWAVLRGRCDGLNDGELGVDNRSWEVAFERWRRREAGGSVKGT